MRGHPKLTKTTRLERDPNPVTRAVLRRAFGDGKWRTAYDMSVTLGDRIPDHLAARAVLGSPKLAKASLEVRLKAGRKRLVMETINAAVSSKVFEARKGDHGPEYRCIKPMPRRMCVGDKLSLDAMTRPAPGTRCGVSRPQIYQAIETNPDINIDGLIVLLTPCMLDGEIIDCYINEYVRRSVKKDHRSEAAVRAAMMDRRNADPDVFLNKARWFLIRTLVSSLIIKDRVAEACTFRITQK